MEYEGLDNSTYDEDITPGRSPGEIAHEVILVIFCICGIFADALITYTILRFKRIRTIPNILLANWAIADICYILTAPSGYRIISILDHISMSREFSCGLLHFGTLLHFTVILLAIIASIDWFIAAYFTKTSETIRSYYRYILATLWITSFLICGITTGLCIAHMRLRLFGYLLWGSVFVLLIITIILQCWRAICRYCLKKPIEHSCTVLNLCTILAACNSLGFLISVFSVFYIYHPFIVSIAECLIFSSAFFNLIILYFTNKDFQACILQALKRFGGGYEESINDFENPVYKNTVVRDKFLVTMSYDKQNELLITNEY